MRQFLLLIRKDFILMRRNKLWTFFEIFVPIIIMGLIMFGLFKMRDELNSETQPTSFNPIFINGTKSDFDDSGIYYNYWCGQTDLRFGYSSKNGNLSNARTIISAFGKRIKNSKVNVELVEGSKENDLIFALENDVKNGSGCRVNTFIGAVIFDEIDFTNKILKYRLYIPDRNDENWNFDKNWMYPYGKREEPLYPNPIYYSSAFLTFQHAIESSFLEIAKPSNGSRNPGIELQALPEPSIKNEFMVTFIDSFPSTFALIIFINVVHITREISTENEGVKPYLSAMGLSTPMFYLTHIIVSFAKYLPIIFIVAIPLSMIITLLDIFPLILLFLLFGLGAITLGAMVASFFKTGNNSVKGILIVWGIAIAIPMIYKPEIDNYPICILYGLNIHGAFKLAIEAIMTHLKRERNLSVFTMFDDLKYEFPFGFALLLMIFDCLWMFCVAMLVDKMRTSTDFNWRTLLCWKKSNLKQQNNQDINILEGSNEIDRARSSAESGIVVKNLVKIWSSTGERAVDGLSFEAKQGQVSVLLGHNGAGKSTTFQSLSGIIQPTYGEIKINDRNVVGNGSSTCEFIGLCPQYNPLYNKLTVEEHLWLVNGLKGKQADNNFTQEMNRLLQDVKLGDKKNELSSNLSGGMKRKLCVCMALIGSSEVVLLDEPTAGMDPGARKDVQDLLEREKQNRTILLTTHYMDEAERLGDWILIMSHGKLVSSGTTKFLKQKYGTGYLLTVVLDVNGDKEKMSCILEEVCQYYVPGAKRGERHGQQIEIVLPESNKTTFSFLFKALEAIQIKDLEHPVFSKMPSTLRQKLRFLNTTSFGLSLNTLEQVFITVGDRVEQAIGEGKTNENRESFDKFIRSQSNCPEKSGFSKVFSQMIAIFRKKLLYTFRKWGNLIGQVVVPIFLVLLIVLLSKKKSGIDNKVISGRKLDLTSTRVIWNGNNQNEKIRKILDSEPVKFIHNDFSDNLLNITNKLKGELPPAGFGFSYGNVTLFNLRSYHVTPALISLTNRARLMDSVDSKIPIIESTIVKVSTDIPSEFNEYEKIAKGILTPTMILVLAMITSSFVMFLVDERVSMFAHQQFLTGVSPITFYGVSFIFDFLMYSAVCGICFGIISMSDLVPANFDIVIMFSFIFFFASVPFVYAVSLLFDSPSKANVLLIIYQIVISGVIAIFLYLVMPILVANQKLDEFWEKSFKLLFNFIMPAYAFANAMLIAPFAPPTLSKADLLSFAIQISSESFVAIFLVQHDFPPCEAVGREDARANNANPNDYALVIKNLNKKFGKFTAVDNLNLVIEQKECFGLLGVNGAGKTTTFNILTGQAFSTSGMATIGGRDVTERVSIGYCPQFDALLLDLTGREVLEILGQMHGFKNYREKANLVLDCVGMQKHSNKQIRYYSGGQKRKISVGVALLSPTQMIILDEPTAGIDPKARREIWELLIWTRQNSNSALMLTSHSMDECEALCSRIAVLNRGKLIAIGTSQELKSLYGNNYTMTLTLNNVDDRQKIVHEVKNRIPNSVLRTPETNKTVNLVWQIPKNPQDQWSEKFEMVQNLAKTLDVNDYILSQSSLEETFLRLPGVKE
ncbi:unnamed protein product [Caenorhabditis angaria]|uniref:ABC transporter domain-containing protein n=1 Tax=Caenorhabditis angaria TaxID=860376 RepID=A0A9P1N0B1_9PELO|nr:unnamed protein product [Caenorhabditis angaria]